MWRCLVLVELTEVAPASRAVPSCPTLNRHREDNPPTSPLHLIGTQSSDASTWQFRYVSFASLVAEADPFTQSRDLLPATCPTLLLTPSSGSPSTSSKSPKSPSPMTKPAACSTPTKYPASAPDPTVSFLVAAMDPSASSARAGKQLGHSRPTMPDESRTCAKSRGRACSSLSPRT